MKSTDCNNRDPNRELWPEKIEPVSEGTLLEK